MSEKIRTQQRKFAYGCNKFGTSYCPSLTAFPPSQAGTIILFGHPGAYDDRVRAFLGQREDEQGEVDEEIAKEKWLSVLFEEERSPFRDEKTLSEHRLVAEKLGWVKRN